MKKNKRGDTAMGLRWHPDFRNPAKLPDVKVVRTIFFVRGALFLVFMVGLGLAGYREYSIHLLREDVEAWEVSVASSLAENREAIRLNTEFAQEAKKVQEIAGFWNVPFSSSEFLRRIGEDLPDSVVLSSVRFEGSNKSVTIQGRVFPLQAGEFSPDQYEWVTEFRNRLNDSPYFSSFIREINVQAASRNEANVEFVLVMLAGAEAPNTTP